LVLSEFVLKMLPNIIKIAANVNVLPFDETKKKCCKTQKVFIHFYCIYLGLYGKAANESRTTLLIVFSPSGIFVELLRKGTFS